MQSATKLLANLELPDAGFIKKAAITEPTTSMHTNGEIRKSKDIFDSAII
ncbi:MAG: hypothetical protein PVJ72_15550 [Gammaproteobacteria bacterium]